MQTLAKILVTAIFLMQDMRIIFITQIYRDLYGDATLVPIRMGTNMEGRKPTETSVTAFCHKSVNLSLEEL